MNTEISLFNSAFVNVEIECSNLEATEADDYHESGY